MPNPQTKKYSVVECTQGRIKIHRRYYYYEYEGKPLYILPFTSVVMVAILEVEMVPDMTLCLRLGFLRSPRLDTRLRILCLYLFPVSLNSLNTRGHHSQG